MPDISVKTLAIPVTMLSSVLAGSAFVTDTRSDLDHLKERVSEHRKDFKDSISDLKELHDKLSIMEGKQDLILHTIKRLEKRLGND